MGVGSGRRGHSRNRYVLLGTGIRGDYHGRDTDTDAGTIDRPDQWGGECTGVYTLNREQRVIDLVDAAGGLTTDADITTLNLAAFLVDGSHVVVRRIAEPDAGQLAEQSTGTQPVQPAQTNRVSSTAGNGPINLNAADAQQLMSLPDIGEVKAALIIELRQQLGAFTSIDQLLDVNGIGPKTLEAIRPLITVQ